MAALAPFLRRKIASGQLDPSVAFGRVATPPSIVDWIERNYYLPETSQPMVLQPHQRSILAYALDPAHEFSTIIYSTIKKSGKSAIGGAIGRYLCENGGHRAEVLCVGNDLSQSRTRSYQSILTSIELNPRYNAATKTVPGEWKIVERHVVHLPTNSVIRAISNDNKGEAGANPVCTLFTELWGMTSESSKKLFAELTPVATRDRSIRVIETYAGYEDESKLLLQQYDTGMAGRRLTHDDIDWPFPDQPPIWINHSAGLFMYWDSGDVARRMPWQRTEAAKKYYVAQKALLPRQEYERFHENKWSSSKHEFIHPTQWMKCARPNEIPPLARGEPMVLGVDGSVNNDTTAFSLVSRHPNPLYRDTDIVVRRTRVWYPAEHGGTINLQRVEDEARLWCKLYNIVQVSYDQFQLHQMMTNLSDVAWCKPFGQVQPRNIADKQLYDLIMGQRIWHDGDAEFLQQIKNSAAKASAMADEKMRIVKKRDDSPVDLVVATSMAAHECLRLQL